MRSFSVYISLIVLVLVFSSPLVQAEDLVVRFTDAEGDNASTSDLKGMRMKFDNSTGDYTITFVSTGEDPFIGEIRFNVNLYNPDVGTTECDPAFFQSVGNDFNLEESTEEIVLTGNNPRLVSWDEFDRVAASSAIFGAPDCNGGFGTAVSDLPELSSDFLENGGTSSDILPPVVFRDRFETEPTGEK